MSNDALLDTTVAIDHLRHGNAALGTHLRGGGILFLPLVAWGGLQAGMACSARPAAMRAGMDALRRAVQLLPPTEKTAEQYGRLFGGLAKAGTPIPQNDLWIAALAVEHGLPLATRDSHFARVQGLTLLAW